MWRFSWNGISLSSQTRRTDWRIQRGLCVLESTASWPLSRPKLHTPLPSPPKRGSDVLPRKDGPPPFLLCWGGGTACACCARIDRKLNIPRSFHQRSAAEAQTCQKFAFKRQKTGKRKQESGLFCYHISESSLRSSESKPGKRPCRCPDTLIKSTTCLHKGPLRPENSLTTAASFLLALDMLHLVPMTKRQSRWGFGEALTALWCEARERLSASVRGRDDLNTGWLSLSESQVQEKTMRRRQWGATVDHHVSFVLTLSGLAATTVDLCLFSFKLLRGSMSRTEAYAHVE